MTIIPYTPKTIIRNTEQLARGTGCRFLLVTPSHIPGEYIAIAWKRKLPTTIPHDRVIIQFKGA